MLPQWSKHWVLSVVGVLSGGIVLVAAFWALPSSDEQRDDTGGSEREHAAEIGPDPKKDQNCQNSKGGKSSEGDDSEAAAATSACSAVTPSAPAATTAGPWSTSSPAGPADAWPLVPATATGLCQAAAAAPAPKRRRTKRKPRAAAREVGPGPPEVQDPAGQAPEAGRAEDPAPEAVGEDVRAPEAGEQAPEPAGAEEEEQKWAEAEVPRLENADISGSGFRASCRCTQRQVQDAAVQTEEPPPAPPAPAAEPRAAQREATGASPPTQGAHPPPEVSHRSSPVGVAGGTHRGQRAWADLADTSDEEDVDPAVGAAEPVTPPDAAGIPDAGRSPEPAGGEEIAEAPEPEDTPEPAVEKERLLTSEAAAIPLDKTVKQVAADAGCSLSDGSDGGDGGWVTVQTKRPRRNVAKS